MLKIIPTPPAANATGIPARRIGRSNPNMSKVMSSMLMPSPPGRTRP